MISPAVFTKMAVFSPLPSGRSACSYKEAWITTPYSFAALAANKWVLPPCNRSAIFEGTPSGFASAGYLERVNSCKNTILAPAVAALEIPSSRTLSCSAASWCHLVCTRATRKAGLVDSLTLDKEAGASAMVSFI